MTEHSKDTWEMAAAHLEINKNSLFTIYPGIPYNSPFFIIISSTLDWGLSSVPRLLI